MTLASLVGLAIFVTPVSVDTRQPVVRLMTMDHMSIHRERVYPRGHPFDGELLERAGGRRWLIMRTGCC
jgi:hypothetical protein